MIRPNQTDKNQEELTPSERRIDSNGVMWITFGFAGLGFLIGNLIALTSETIVSSFISLLFVFIGGSVLALLDKLNEHDRKIAGSSILSLSLFCVFGVYTGVLIDEYKLLSPPNARPAARAESSNNGAKKEARNGPEGDKMTPTAAVDTDRHPYVRSGEPTPANQIDRLKDKTINPEEAYQRMYRLAVGYEEQIREGQR